jgi:hypothetical protein
MWDMCSFSARFHVGRSHAVATLPNGFVEGDITLRQPLWVARRFDMVVDIMDVCLAGIMGVHGKPEYW